MLHHKNQNKHSTANHGIPQHEKQHFPSGPAPQTHRKTSVLSKIRERFQEKPATAEEVKQLGLNAKRETYKTAIYKAKSARPGRLDRITGGFGGGGGSRQSSSRRSRPQESGLFGDSNGPSWLMGPSQGPSLNFITGQEDRPRRGRKEESGFGKGLTDMFT